MTTLTRLDDYGFLAITGRDATKFLQGYTTCNLDDVTPDTSRIGAICNLQGRMVTSFRAARMEDGLLLRMSADLIDKTMEFLQKYIVFSKAEMADLSQSIGCYGVHGEVPGDSFPQQFQEVRTNADRTIVRVDAAEPRYEIWAEGEVTDFDDAVRGTPTDWHAHEIDAGQAWVTAATTETFIPQMFDYHRIGGIDFDKGCYLGQEIVARMQHRGKVNRKLFRGHGAELAVGETLMVDGREAGTVVAAAGDRLLAVVKSKDEAPPAAISRAGSAVILEAIDRS